MRIGISINTSWNIYNFREGLVKRIIAEGHEVFTIAPRDKYTDRLIDWGCQPIDIPISATQANPFRELGLLLHFIRLIKKHNLEMLLTFTIKPNLYGTLAARFCKIPVICNVSGLGTVFLTDDLKSKVARILYNLVFRFASVIFFQNKHDKALFLQRFSIREDQTNIIPGSGINLKKFEKLPYHPSDKITFLMISRVIREKGVKEYAEAASVLLRQKKSIECILIGKHELTHSRSISKKELEKWQNEGMIYRDHTDDIISEIRKADVIVLPSYREGMSRTLLEAASSGRALITTDVPGCREIVRDQVNGLLVEPKNSHDLLEKMEYFINLTSEEKVKYADESRVIAEKYFDESLVIEAYIRNIRRFDKIDA